MFLRHWWNSKQPSAAARRRLAPRTSTCFRPECEPLEERDLLAVFVVTNPGDNGNGSLAGSLSSAILAANTEATNPGMDTINFNIGGGGVQTITVATNAIAAVVNGPVLIDGTSQPNTSGASGPLIQINLGGLSGLTLGNGSSGSTIKGLAMVNGTTAALGINSNNNLVLGSYFGVQANGSTIQANAGDGIRITGSTNTLGGAGTAGRLIVSGNTSEGIDISGGSGNLVQNSFIGLAIDGVTAIANGNEGVLIRNAASSQNTIGGADSSLGNVISGNSATGVVIESGSSNNVIQNNLIGLQSNGTAARANGDTGIDIASSANNRVLNNTISGNTSDGLQLRGTTSNTLIQGNIIGLDMNGLITLKNGADGISVDGGGFNTIGGTSSSARNLISGNGGDGLVFNAASKGGNIVQGNYIGIDKTGTSPRGNGGDGIDLSGGAGSNTIGGSASGAGNVIAGNTLFGISIGSGTDNRNVIQGNNIGTNAPGTGAAANLKDGIIFAAASASNTIGGTASGAGNLIAGNVQSGINFLVGGADQNQVQGNWIGVQRDGKTALANTLHGIFLQGGASKNTIGGTESGAGNVIAFNALNGVTVGAVVDTTTNNNTLSGNSIFKNGLLGIDVNNDGITPNDLQDPDGGGNNKQNFPVLTTATTTNGTTTISGTMNGIASQIIAVEVFASDEADPNGNGEGQTFLGSQLVQLDSQGNGSFSVSTTQIVSGKFLTATGTMKSTPPAAGGAIGDTGEFSKAFQFGTSTTTPPTSTTLSITKTDAPDPVQGGSNVTYTLSITSTGANNNNVVVTDTLPTNGTLVSATASTGTVTTSTAGVVTASLGLVASGQSPTVTIVVRAPSTAGTMSNSAKVTSTENPSGTNQTVTQSTTVQVGNALAAFGSDQGVASSVQAFNADSGAALWSTAPFGTFTGGVTVAVGDFNGDGQDDVVTGAGPGGGPIVSVRNGKDGSQLTDGKLNLFFAFGGPETGGNQNITNGVNVAVGDVNGDGTPDIITGTGSAAPLVVVWNGATGTILSAFFAFSDSPTFLGGVRVAAADVNGDGKDDVIVGRGAIPAEFLPFISAAQAAQATPEVRVYNGATLPSSLTQLSGGIVFDSSFRGGVYVGGLSGGNIVVGPGSGGGAIANVMSAAGPSLSFVVGTTIGSGNTGARVAGIIDQSNPADGKIDVLAGQGPGRTANPAILDAATLASIDTLFTNISGGVFVGASRR